MMNEEELRPFHARANTAAWSAIGAIRSLQAQADEIMPGLASAPDEELRNISPVLVEAKEEVLDLVGKINVVARQYIEEVVDQLPEKASEKDRELVREKAIDILEGRAEFQEKDRIDFDVKGTFSLDFNFLLARKQRDPEPDPPEPDDPEPDR